jgi:chemotaxis response regulator CheB
MPRAVAEAGLVDVVGPLDVIAARINESLLVGAAP